MRCQQLMRAQCHLTMHVTSEVDSWIHSQARIDSDLLHMLQNAMLALTEGLRNFITSSSIQRNFFRGKI